MPRACPFHNISINIESLAFGGAVSMGPLGPISPGFKRLEIDGHERHRTLEVGANRATEIIQGSARAF